MRRSPCSVFALSLVALAACSSDPPASVTDAAVDTSPNADAPDVLDVADVRADDAAPDVLDGSDVTDAGDVSDVRDVPVDTACPAETHRCGDTCARDSDVATCGSRCAPCPAPAHASARCAMGACDFVCDDTWERVGDACVRLDPPRPIAPLPTAFVTSRRPTVRWSLATGTDGAVLELCADLACDRVIERVAAMGDRARPTRDLPAGPVFWRLRGAAGAREGTVTTAMRWFVVPPRSAAVDTSWGSSLDLNGDGLCDVAVAAPSYSTATGRAFVYNAGAAAPTVTLDGRDGPNTVFGSALTAAGDLDGDGLVDLAAGAYRALSGTGRVYVYPGSRRAFVDPTPTVTLTGRDGADASFGVRVAGVGDVNGDGYADLAVGAATAMRSLGRAYVFHGGATGLSTTPATTLTGVDASGIFGVVLASAGDVNGDGFGDVAVAAQSALTATGRVYLYLGSATGLGTTAAAVLTGPDGMLSDFGVALAAGDVNGDGYSDLVVGASRVATFVGRAYLYLGSAAGLSTTPARTWSGTMGTDTNVGSSLAVCDLNRDGFADVALWGNDPATGGRVRVFAGGDTGPGATALTTLTAPEGASSGYGVAMQCGGDVGGAGFGSLLVGAPLGGEMRTGTVYRYAITAAGPEATPSSRLAHTGGANEGFGAMFVGAVGR